MQQRILGLIFVDRAGLGLKAGDQVIMRVENNELRISSVNHSIERVQALVRKYNRKGESLSESLIRDRRAEAAKEENGP